MKTALYALAVLMIFVGAIWILQGADILQGSFMTGQSEWLIIGIFMAGIGIGGIIYLQRNESKEPPQE